MTGSYRPPPASPQHGYTPHAYGGSPADGLVQTFHENSPSRRRPGENRDTRKTVAYRDSQRNISVFHPQPYESHVSSIDDPGQSFGSTTARMQQEIMYGRDIVPQSPIYPTGMHRQEQIRRQRLAYAGRPPVNYRFSIPAATSFLPASSASKYTRPDSHAAPVVFGNLYDSASVATGVSQQELLRKRVREDSKKKRHRKAKKKNARPIVNIPLTLTQALTAKKSYYGNINSVAGSDINYHHEASFTGDSASKKYRPLTTVHDDIEQSTAESTRTDEPTLQYRPDRTARSNNYGTPSLYSTLPAQQSVLNEADGDSILLWATLDDAQSTDSFPILSNHCGISFSGHENMHEFYTPRLNEEDGILTPLDVSRSRVSDTNASSVDSSRSRRAVRFSHQDSYSSVPWDERQDAEFALDFEEGEADAGPALPASQTAVVTPQPSDSPPRSILRAARFSPGKAGARTSKAYYAQLQAFRDKHYRRTEAIADRDLTTTAYRSPPRQDTVFADPEGDELSPIQTSPSRAATRTSALRMDNLDSQSEDRKSTRAFREILKQANSLYHSSSPNFPEDEDTFLPLDANLDDQSQNSEPGPEMFEEEVLSDEDIDDEASLLDAANFIQTIAAVVIQTAFRRYRVQWIYSDMLARRRLLRRRQGMSSSTLVSNPVHQAGLVASRRINLEPIASQAMPNNGARESTRVTAVLKPQRLPFDENAAATRVQAFFRGYWTRDCISVDAYCATLIQKTWRSHQARHGYLFDLYSIVLVQALWRRSMARLHVGIQLYAIYLIQKTARGFLARKNYRAMKRARGSKAMTNRFKQKYLQQTSPSRNVATLAPTQKHVNLRRKNTAATMIQKSWRRFRDERMYIKSLVDILTVQTIVRSWIADRREMGYNQTKLSSLHLQNPPPSSKSARMSWNTATGHQNGAPGSHANARRETGPLAHANTRSAFDMWQERDQNNRDAR